jgi:hypothetical protein
VDSDHGSFGMAIAAGFVQSFSLGVESFFVPSKQPMAPEKVTVSKSPNRGKSALAHHSFPFFRAFMTA